MESSNTSPTTPHPCKAIEALLASCRTEEKISVIAKNIENAVIELYEPEFLQVTDVSEIESIVRNAFEEVSNHVEDEEGITAAGKALFRKAIALIQVFDIVHEAQTDWLDGVERARDPYAYYGVSPKDFL
jgi:hypothetical protein